MNAPEPIAEASGFSTQQKDYLQGFAAGLAAIDALPGAGIDVSGNAAIAAPAEPPTWFGWPVDEITREEAIKRDGIRWTSGTRSSHTPAKTSPPRAATSTGSSSLVSSGSRLRSTRSWCAYGFRVTY